MAEETKQVRLRIITPEEIKVDERAAMIIMRCTTGDMGILPGHEARSAVLDYGVLRILNPDGERRIAVFGGLAEVRDDVVTVLANAAEWPEDIDRARAEADRELAERRLQETQDDLEVRSNQAVLRRSLVQIEVSSYPLLSVPVKKE
ncbi:MAG: ATP synthase F1 subunit epsilon [Oscillospiraceae bacterium]|nr:ATP synthase F1 subunit epsilon [Oscillospiraceae bacterium]